MYIRMFGHILLAMFVVTGALCCSTVALAEKPEPEPVSGKIKWVFDYQQGKRLSRETDKPMFVVFRCER